MRATTRLLAKVQPSRFLEAGTPTGLTGLFTHAAPRSTLIYLYSATLERLARLPESSVYRQSTENLTKHRLNIVSSVKPAGYDEWSARAAEIVAKHPDVFGEPDGQTDGTTSKHAMATVAGRTFIQTQRESGGDELVDEWDNEEAMAGKEGTGGARGDYARVAQAYMTAKAQDNLGIEWEAEPKLTREQIGDVENLIGAGLIEEVVEVAKAELELVEVMAQAKVWEDLEEKPLEGQWTYFKRDTGTPETQAPQPPQQPKN